MLKLFISNWEKKISLKVFLLFIFFCFIWIFLIRYTVWMRTYRLIPRERWLSQEMTIAPRGVRTPEYFIKLPQYMSFLFCGKYGWRHRVNYGYLFRNLSNYQSFFKIVESWKSEIVKIFEGFFLSFFIFI